MAKRPPSRFESIFRAELQAGKGMLSSLGTAGSESQKEKRDLRNLLPKSGILGAILENKFGKSYRYSGSKGPSIESKSATVQAVSSKILAKNSMFLPIIAKDMNIMRQTIQQIARKQGIKPKTQENYGRSVSAEPTTSSAPSSGGSAAKPGMFSGIADSLGSIGGGLLGLGGAMISGLIGSIGSIGGSFLRGLTSMVGFGLPGIIGLIAGGYVVYSLAKSIDFSKIGTDLYKVFGDAFDEITKALKTFFNIKEGEGFLEGFARQLDEAFNTSFFTKNLNDASKALAESTNFISNKIDTTFNTIMAHGVAAAKTLGDVMIAVGKDLIGYTRQWMSQQRDTLYMLIGAAIGGVVGGAVGGVAGAIIGAATGAKIGQEWSKFTGSQEQKTAESYEKNFGSKEGAIKQLESQIQKGSQMLDANVGKSDDAALNMSDPNSRKWLASYLSLRTGGKQSPEYFEEQINKDRRDHAGRAPSFEDWTVGRIRKEVSSFEQTLRLLDPKRDVSNLEKMDWKGSYERNLESGRSMFPESSPSASQSFPLKDDVKSKDQFAKFPSAEAGFKAQRALWERSYSKMTIAEALKSWSPTATANYGKGLEKAIGASITSTKFSDLSESQKVALLNEQARQEGFFSKGSLPNRMNNPGALKFRSWETAYGAEPSGVGEYGKKVQTAGSPTPDTNPPKIQNTLTADNKPSDVELILGMFGEMFGDLSTSLFKLAEAGQASSAKTEGKASGTSGEASNYDIMIDEMGLHRVMRG